MNPYLPSHLSPSQFTTYSLCPLMYYERYVLKIEPPAEPERLFGIAVHKGLEAQFRGEDDEMAFINQWREYLATLDLPRYPAIGSLKARGLELLAQVRALGLTGEPERQIIVLTAGITIPIMGFTDLWCDGLIVDFKTAGFGWTQTKADAQLFQPAIYSHAYSLEHDGALPRFQFVVLPRINAPIQVFDGTRSSRQIVEMFERAREIHQLIEAQEFACTCAGRFHIFNLDFDEAA